MQLNNNKLVQSPATLLGTPVHLLLIHSANHMALTRCMWKSRHQAFKWWFKYFWTDRGCWCQTGWSEIADFHAQEWSEPHWVLLLSAKNRKLKLKFTQVHLNWQKCFLYRWVNFCCDNQMVESEFVINKKIRSILPYINSLGWWCVGDIFTACFEPHNTKRGSKSKNLLELR